jgi:hypothetical protein
LGATITFNNETFQAGSGFGNVASILSVSKQGNGTTEYGSVLRNASNTADLITDNGSPVANLPGTRTWSLGELAARPTPVNVTADSFGVVFNLNEKATEPAVTLGGFTLRFYDYANDSSFDVSYAGPTVFSELSQGTGSSGFLFHVNFQTDAEKAWFDNAANRVGMILTASQQITGASAGAEGFYIAAPPISAPLPAPNLLAGAGLIGLAVRRRFTRRP